jgi:hypothetical protein
MKIDISEYSVLPREAEAKVLLDLLQEIGANIYHCNELFKLYWIPSMADEANNCIALAAQIKKRIVLLVGAAD